MSAYNTIRRIASGDIDRPAFAAVAAICEAMGISLSKGEPADDDASRAVREAVATYEEKIPVIAFASAGAPVIFTDQGFPMGSGMYQVSRPAGLTDPNAFGVEVEGDSMFPKYREGQAVIVDTRKSPADGDFAVVGLTNGEKYIKMWRQRNGAISLESLNPDYPPIKVKREDVRFAYKVVWARER
jgi:phage repressor protein C with HTH and peptisase S24 domain